MAEGINTRPLWAERLGVHMVKRPRQVMRYSPSAGKHTLHTVERVKKKRASSFAGVSADSVVSWPVTEVSLVPSPMAVKSPPSVSTFSTAARKRAKRTTLLASEPRNSNLSTVEVFQMTNHFLRVSAATAEANPSSSHEPPLPSPAASAAQR